MARTHAFDRWLYRGNRPNRLARMINGASARLAAAGLGPAQLALRGLLLNACGWWQVGQIMLISAIVAFAAAGLFLILSGLGFWHLRRTAPGSEVFPAPAVKAGARA